jgi:kindlin 2
MDFLCFVISSQEHQYAEWLAACRLAAKGKTLSDSSFEMEVNSIKAFLSMQSPAATPAINPNSLEIVAEDYVAPRFARKIKSKVRIYCTEIYPLIIV